MRRAIDVTITVVLLVGFAWLGHLYHHNRWGHQPPRGVDFPEEIIAQTPSGDLTVVLRDALPERAVFLVLSADCRFCEENGPKWRALADRLQDLPGAHLVVLSISEPAETDAYLRKHSLNVPVLHLDHAELETLGLRGVPATLAVNSGSGRMRPWLGVLDDSDQKAITAWAAAP